MLRLLEIDFCFLNGQPYIITSDHVKLEFASSEQGVDDCFLVHASVRQLDWERLINGVAFIEGRRVDFFPRSGADIQTYSLLDLMFGREAADTTVEFCTNAFAVASYSVGSTVVACSNVSPGALRTCQFQTISTES